MKLSYKGFELIAKRDRDLDGEYATFGSAFRESDKWELDSPGPLDCSIQDMVEELKYVVDDYIKNPKEYED